MKGTMLFFWRREIDMKGVIEKIFHNKRISRRKRSFTTFMESGKSSQAIRKGLIFMTPLVIISSLARVGLSFPVNGYQEWLNSADAFSFLQILTRIYSSTTDYFSLILSFSVAWCYAEQLKIKLWTLVC